MFVTHPRIVKTLAWPDEAATQAFASHWAHSAAIRTALITLQGDLGAGKTTFTRHLLRALGVAGRVKSPSYAVVEPYVADSLSIWHFDLYRFSDPREFEDAGFRDLLAQPGLKLVEWPEKGQGILPTPDVAMRIAAMDDDSRAVKLYAFTARGEELLA